MFQNGGRTEQFPRKNLQQLCAPHDVHVLLTSRCQLSCLHCIESCNRQANLEQVSDLSGFEWASVFQELSRIGVFFVNLAGGEPTKHPDFIQIVDSLVQEKLHFILTTNGLGSRSCTEAIVRAKSLLIGLKVSLDGPTPASHGFLRTDPNNRPYPRAFERTMKTLRVLQEREVPFTVATCLHQGNISLMQEFKRLILELRPTSWFLSTIAPVGQARHGYERIFASDSTYSSEFWSELKAECETAGIYVRFADMSTAEHLENRPSHFTCPAATQFCDIGSDGMVSPCPLARVIIPPNMLRFDSVREKPIQEIWNGTAFETFRRWRTIGCEGCMARKACDRCVAQSIQWFGRPDKPAPYCVDKGEELQLLNLNALREMLCARRQEVLA